MSRQFPEAWRTAALVPLLKGGGKDVQNPANYRRIALLSCLCKFFANVLERRLTGFQHDTHLICKEQFGFVKHRRAEDACFILDTLIDHAVANSKCLYVAFVDFEKTYDFIPRDALFFKMLHAHMHGPVLRVLHNMYSAVYSVVQLGSNVS